MRREAAAAAAAAAMYDGDATGAGMLSPLLFFADAAPGPAATSDVGLLANLTVTGSTAPGGIVPLRCLIACSASIRVS